MRVLPILFNTDMVRAILEGRKTVTRRLVKHDLAAILISPYHKEHPEVEDKQIISKLCMPPYQPGDILYVRETWSPVFVRPRRYLYKVGCKEAENLPVKWHPSIHMPKEAARIWLKVKDVRVERLQEMEPVDVIKEGAYQDCCDCIDTYGESGSQCCYKTEDECSQCDSVMMEWEKLWNSTIKKSDIDRYGWDASPWVWVIDFERCESPYSEDMKTTLQIDAEV